MNIPPKYEDVVAQLEASNKLCDSLERSMKNHRHELGLSTGREAALREELDCPFRIARHSKRLIEELKQRLTVSEQRAADNLKLISGLVEYADNLLADVNNAWIYAGSTGEPETHKDEDYAAALNLLSATVSSHE